MDLVIGFREFEELGNPEKKNMLCDLEFHSVSSYYPNKEAKHRKKKKRRKRLSYEEIRKKDANACEMEPRGMLIRNNNNYYEDNKYCRLPNIYIYILFEKNVNNHY